MKKYLIIFICLWGGVGFSCSNWLDVKPSDRISEDNNFSSLVGFKKTLNGVYIELNSSLNIITDLHSYYVSFGDRLFFCN